MVNWLNKQSYLSVALLVSIFFGIGIFICALASGVDYSNSGYAGLFLGALSLVGFSFVKYTIPDTKDLVIDLDHTKSRT